MTRLASALILVGMVPVVRVLLEPSGPTSIPFTFFSMPCVGAGIALYLLVRLRETRSSG